MRDSIVGDTLDRLLHHTFIVTPGDTLYLIFRYSLGFHPVDGFSVAFELFVVVFAF